MVKTVLEKTRENPWTMSAIVAVALAIVSGIISLAKLDERVHHLEKDLTRLEAKKHEHSATEFWGIQ